MSHVGLGGVKTRASAARVEYLGGIARRESQIMLRPCGATPDLENCIFYISPMYEFSHRLGHERPKGDVRVESVRLSTADIGRRGL
jgi:hypothetical protein